MNAELPRSISLIGQLAVMAAASLKTEMTPSSHVFPDREMGAIIESDARYIDVIGLITKHADCCMALHLANTFVRYYYFFETGQKNQSYP